MRRIAVTASRGEQKPPEGLTRIGCHPIARAVTNGHSKLGPQLTLRCRSQLQLEGLASVPLHAATVPIACPEHISGRRVPMVHCTSQPPHRETIISTRPSALIVKRSHMILAIHIAQFCGSQVVRKGERSVWASSEPIIVRRSQPAMRSPMSKVGCLANQSESSLAFAC